jgi:hypothetical protein
MVAGAKFSGGLDDGWGLLEYERSNPRSIPVDLTGL